MEDTNNTKKTTTLFRKRWPHKKKPYNEVSFEIELLCNDASDYFYRYWLHPNIAFELIQQVLKYASDRNEGHPAVITTEIIYDVLAFEDDVEIDVQKIPVTSIHDDDEFRVRVNYYFTRLKANYGHCLGFISNRMYGFLNMVEQDYQDANNFEVIETQDRLRALVSTIHSRNLLEGFPQELVSLIHSFAGGRLFVFRTKAITVKIPEYKYIIDDSTNVEDGMEWKPDDEMSDDDDDDDVEVNKMFEIERYELDEWDY